MSHHPSARKLVLAATTLSLALAGISNAQETTLKVSPANPTIYDHVSLVLSGVWSDSCTPGRVVAGRVSRQGASVDVVFNFNDPALSCAAVLTPFTAEIALGKLPAGAYTADLSALRGLMLPVPIGSATFTVTPPEESTFYVPGFRSEDGVLGSYFSAYNNSPSRVELQLVAAFGANGRRDLSLPPLALEPGASGQLDTQNIPAAAGPGGGDGAGVQFVAVKAQSHVVFRPALERFTASTESATRASLGRLPLPIFKGLVPAGATTVAGDVKLFGEEGCDASARRVNLTLFNGGTAPATFEVVARAVGGASSAPVYTQSFPVPAETTIQMNDLPLLSPALCASGLSSVWFEVVADQPSASYVSSTVLKPVATAIPYEIYPSRLEY